MTAISPLRMQRQPKASFLLYHYFLLRNHEMGKQDRDYEHNEGDRAENLLAVDRKSDKLRDPVLITLYEVEDHSAQQ